MSARTSPRCNSSETPPSATTPGKRLTMPVILRSAFPIASVACPPAQAYSPESKDIAGTSVNRRSREDLSRQNNLSRRRKRLPDGCAAEGSTTSRLYPSTPAEYRLRWRTSSSSRSRLHCFQVLLEL